MMPVVRQTEKPRQHDSADDAVARLSAEKALRSFCLPETPRFGQFGQRQCG
jgi:hypothetical protein